MPTWATPLLLYKDENQQEKAKVIKTLNQISKELKEEIEKFKVGGTSQDLTSKLNTVSNTLATLYKTIYDRFYPQTSLEDYGLELKQVKENK